MESSISNTAPRLRVDLVADPQCIAFVSDVTKSFLVLAAGLDEKSQAFSHLHIAVVEMVTNVVRYAYRDREPGPLTLDLTASDGWISARIRDRGTPFDSTGKATMPDPTELAEGGYGLGIVQSVMDETAYAYRVDTGNVFTMRKRIPVARGAAGEQR